MNGMPRLKPDPIPAIFPLPEYAAVGARKAVYEETKAALGVPWMGVVTMAFSHYPSFYAALWSGVGPLCRTPEFLSACNRLRAFAEASVTACELVDLRPELLGNGWSGRELSDIRAAIEVFAAGNMPYVLIATLARLLLAGRGLSTEAFMPMGAVPVAADAGARHAPLVLMERHHADPRTVAVYDDIQATLGLPFVNTDYRALARWPSYFGAAWADLKKIVASPAYEPMVAAVHDEAVRLALALPAPAALTPQALGDAALADAKSGVVESTVQLFQWLLPGLVLNVACLQRQLDDGLAARDVSGSGV